VLLIRRIRELLYEQGFTISGARNRLLSEAEETTAEPAAGGDRNAEELGLPDVKRELKAILDLLGG
jgi:hypothetical protein